MKLTLLGTGHAMVTRCYNTCFALEDNGETMLVDGGNGSDIYRQLRAAKIDMRSIHSIFVTHKHLDHITGIFWLLRMLLPGMERDPGAAPVTIYGHDEVIDVINTCAHMLFQPHETRHIGEKLRLVAVADGQALDIIGHRVVFFDIHSTKAKQFGFTMYLDGGEKLTCCGDEPCSPPCEEYVRGSKWLLHEAFCLYSQADRYHPYEKHHSTVKDACCLAQRLNVRNLILYHTEDSDIANRKQIYTAEGAQFFGGGLFVPDDLEQFTL